MHRLTYILLFLGLCGPLYAAKCDTDVVPAATLLFPYFELDLDDPSGSTTLISITNRDAQPVLANVTLWTEWAITTSSFEIYLSGYDIQTLNLRDVFVFGRLPQTGSAVSPHGQLSEPPVEFPGCNDTTTAGAAPVYPDPALGGTELARLRAFHTGECFDGEHASTKYEDGFARGYLTVDAVNRCSGMTPADPGYFGAGGTGVGSDRNALMGDYFFVEPGEDFAQGEQAVHVEAFPGGFAASDYTFYRRHVEGTAIDDREPLGTQYQARHLVGSGFDGGTEFIVWRDPGSPDAEPVECGKSPLWARDVVFGLPSYQVVFDESGNAMEDAPEGSCDILPPCGIHPLPWATQKVGFPLSEDLPAPPDLGATYVVLRRPIGDDPGDWETLQGWVSAVVSAENRYSVGQHAVRLDSACDPGEIRPGPGDFEQ